MTVAPGEHRGDRRRVLITGGAGFIGSHLVDALLARGDRVVVVDDLSTGKRENLPLDHEALEFVEGTVSASLPSLANPAFDEVYHLAAAVGVQRIMDDPVAAIETNVGQTSDLLDWVVARDPTPAVLIASSSEVYGKGSGDPFREDDDVVYGPTTVARWSYGCSKAIDEFLALAHARDRALPVVVARFFNTVGPRQTGRYGMVLPRFVAAATEGRPLTVYGDGLQSRCFCDVRDVARTLPRLLGSPTCYGRVFNVGSDREITIAALAALVGEALGCEIKIEKVPYAEAYGSGFEDLRRRRPDLTRIRDTIGFSPSISLEQTIRDIALAATDGANV